MLRVVENSKPQSRPEIFDNSAKLDLVIKEGNPEFEPLVIGIANNPTITLSLDNDSTSHANSTKDGVITDSVTSAINSMNSQNTESKFEISKYDTQKERDELFNKIIV